VVLKSTTHASLQICYQKGILIRIWDLVITKSRRTTWRQCRRSVGGRFRGNTCTTWTATVDTCFALILDPIVTSGSWQNYMTSMGLVDLEWQLIDILVAPSPRHTVGSILWFLSMTFSCKTFFSFLSMQKCPKRWNCWWCVKNVFLSFNLHHKPMFLSLKLTELALFEICCGAVQIRGKNFGSQSGSCRIVPYRNRRFPLFLLTSVIGDVNSIRM